MFSLGLSAKYPWLTERKGWRQTCNKLIRLNLLFSLLSEWGDGNKWTFLQCSDLLTLPASMFINFWKKANQRLVGSGEKKMQAFLGKYVNAPQPPPSPGRRWLGTLDKPRDAAPATPYARAVCELSNPSGAPVKVLRSGWESRFQPHPAQQTQVLPKTAGKGFGSPL